MLYTEDGEGFVDFEEVDILERRTCSFQDSRDSIYRTITHDSWRYTNSRSHHEFAKDGETEAFGDGTAGKQNSRTAAAPSDTYDAFPTKQT
jgi:hypothetical protein